MNRINLISFRQQAASLGVAAVMTIAVLASLSTMANNGYNSELAQADAASVAAVSTDKGGITVQQVVVLGKRQA